MKNKFRWIGFAVLTAMLMIGLTGCPDEEVKTPKPNNTEAILESITFGADGDTFSSELLEPISFDDYPATGQFPEGNRGSIIVKNIAALSKDVTMKISPNATVSAIRTGNANAPNIDTAYENGTGSGEPIAGMVTTGANPTNYIFIRVTSGNEATVNFYAFRVTVQASSADLSSVTIGGVAVASIGTPAATIAGVTTKGKAVLASTATSGALVASLSGAAHNADKAYAIQRGAGEPAFTATAPTHTFQDGDVIIIRVISENKEVTMFYVIDVEVGRSTNLTSIVIGGVTLEAADYGTPNTDPANFTGVDTGAFEPGIPMPLLGFSIAATAFDSGATVAWAKGKTPPTTYGTTTPIVFEDDEFLFIRVTPATAGAPLGYYKIGVVLERSLNILYGTPNMRNPDTSAGANPRYIDNIWNDPKIRQFNVSRVNLNETTPHPWFYATGAAGAAGDGHTTATAKALWDDTGLYVYVDVTFKDFVRNGAQVTRELYPGTSHDSDNVEVFTNERYQSYKSGNYGSQLRIGPQNRTVTGANRFGARSGETGNATAAGMTSVYDMFNAASFTDFNSWVKTEGDTDTGKQLGYVVLLKAPWGGKNASTANEVFDSTTGLVRTHATDINQGPAIGMEIQLNVRTEDGGSDRETRDAILTWNGVHGKAYQNVASYGIVNLVMGDIMPRVITVADPRITTQPEDRNYVLAEVQGTGTIPLLSIAATSDFPTVHALSYEWFVTKDSTLTSPFTTGTTLAAGVTKLATTTVTHRPGTEVDAGGYYYYWVQVTNTRATATTTDKTKTILSRRVTVDVESIERPRITQQPTGGVYLFGAVPAPRHVEVAPLSTDHGVLSYQWYSANSATATVGTAVSNTIGGNTHTINIPSQTTASETWYWVVVTNTLGGVTSETKSNTIRIAFVETITYTLASAITFTGTGNHSVLQSGLGFTLNKTNAANNGNTYLRFRVNLGTGRNLSNFSGITVDYTPLTGDFNHKNIRFMATNSDTISVPAWDSPVTTAPTIAQVATGDITANTTYNYTMNWGNTAQITALTTNNPRFAFSQGSTQISYRIENIVFIANDGGSNVYVRFGELSTTPSGVNTIASLRVGSTANGWATASSIGAGSAGNEATNVQQNIDGARGAISLTAAQAAAGNNIEITLTDPTSRITSIGSFNIASAPNATTHGQAQVNQTPVTTGNVHAYTLLGDGMFPTGDNAATSLFIQVTAANNDIRWHRIVRTIAAAPVLQPLQITTGLGVRAGNTQYEDNTPFNPPTGLFGFDFHTGHNEWTHVTIYFENDKNVRFNVKKARNSWDGLDVSPNIPLPGAMGTLAAEALVYPFFAPGKNIYTAPKAYFNTGWGCQGVTGTGYGGADGAGDASAMMTFVKIMYHNENHDPQEFKPAGW